MNDSAGAAGLERDFGLGGKVALITGSTRGIGLTMAEAFADAGASLVIASNEAEACVEVAAELTARGADALGHPVDVTRGAELERMVEAVMARFGQIDILVANAGISPYTGPMAEADDEIFDRIMEVNLRHPLRLANLVAPLMAARSGGSIIVTASISGLRGNKAIGHYALSKAALMQLVRNLAVEWGPANIRANAIAPGLIDTDWTVDILSNPESTERRLSLTPLRRVGTKREVAATAVFLAGPGAAFITGQTIVVDGGTLITDGN